jgi:hypothetical protein
MKKLEEFIMNLRNRLFNFFNNHFPEREFNLNAKRDAIVHDLTHNNFSELTMAQTIDLKRSVDEKLYKIINEKGQFHIQELNAINEFNIQKISFIHKN